MSTDCIFCKIISGTVPACKLFEDDHVLAFMDIAPASHGHCLVIPKKHVESLADCPGDMLANLTARLTPLAQAAVEAAQADGCNVLCNNGRAAGQVVPHLHFHIIPRTTGDGLLSNWPSTPYAPGQMEQIAERIRRAL